jgi:hypothetical protein
MDFDGYCTCVRRRRWRLPNACRCGSWVPVRRAHARLFNCDRRMESTNEWGYGSPHRCVARLSGLVGMWPVIGVALCSCVLVGVRGSALMHVAAGCTSPPVRSGHVELQALTQLLKTPITIHEAGVPARGGTVLTLCFLRRGQVVVHRLRLRLRRCGGRRRWGARAQVSRRARLAKSLASKWPGTSGFFASGFVWCCALPADGDPRLSYARASRLHADPTPTQCVCVGGAGYS